MDWAQWRRSGAIPVRVRFSFAAYSCRDSCGIGRKNRLHRIQLRESSARKFFTHLVVPNPERLGPSASRLLECLRTSHKLQQPELATRSSIELAQVELSDSSHTPE